MRIIEQSAIIENWNKMSLAHRVERAARLCYGRTKEKEARSFVKALVEKKHFSPLEFARVWIEGGLFLPHSINLRDLRRESLSSKVDPSNLARMVNAEYPEFFEDIHHKWHKPMVTDGGKYNWYPDNTWIPVLITTNRAISHQIVRHRHDIAIMQESQRYTKMLDNVDFIRPSAYWEPNSPAEDTWIDAMTECEHEYAHALERGYSAQAARLFLSNSAATRVLIYASPGEWGYIFKLRCSEKADPMMRALMCPLRDEFLNRGYISQDYLDNVGRYW